MNEKLQKLLEKDLADLTTAERAEVKKNFQNLEENDKEKFIAVLDDSDEDDTLKVKGTYDAKLKVAVASTDVEDRHGESINQDGWALKDFKNNPVLLWGHDHNKIAVGNARNIHIERTSGTPKLVFTPVFHDKTEDAKALGELYNEGWLNSFSVGFIPTDFDGKENRYISQELLEISAVNVPANPEARMMAYKSLQKKGFKDSVAKDVTGVDTEENEDDETVPEKLKQLLGIKEENKFVDKFKTQRGAIADEIQEDRDQDAKYENLENVYEVFWAFLDVYYDPETSVDDFNSLLAEFITILGTIQDGSYVPDPNDDDEDEGDAPVEDSLKDLDPETLTLDQAKALIAKQTEKKIIDQAKEILAIDKSAESKVLDKNLENEEDDNKTAKTQVTKTPVAPNTKEARAKQSLSKVIAKASDKILAGKPNKDTVEMTKVIKRAAEILNQAGKTK